MEANNQLIESSVGVNKPEASFPRMNDPGCDYMGGDYSGWIDNLGRRIDNFSVIHLSRFFTFFLAF